MRAEVVVEVNVANKAALIASAEMVLIAFVLISSPPFKLTAFALYSLLRSREASPKYEAQYQ
jgi:hypothetical protein